MNPSSVVRYIVLAVTLLITLPGCSHSNTSLLRPRMPVHDARIKSLVAFYSDEQKVAAFYRGGIDFAQVADSSGIITTAHTYSTIEARRNKILYDLIFLINDHYDRYELSRYATVTGLSFGGDVATLGLDTAATAVGGAGVKTILTAISAGIGGTKIAAQRDFLQNQNIALLIQKMRQLRQEVYTRMQAHMKSPESDYPLEAGFLELQQYFHAGTLIGAMQALSNETGAAQLITEARDAQNVRAQALVTAAAEQAKKGKKDGDPPSAGTGTTQ